MRAPAEGMPGFVSFKTFRADDGERVSVIEFASEEALRAWREHPEHRKAQELGRATFSRSSRSRCVPSSGSTDSSGRTPNQPQLNSSVR